MAPISLVKLSKSNSMIVSFPWTLNHVLFCRHFGVKQFSCVDKIQLFIIEYTDVMYLVFDVARNQRLKRLR